MYKMTIGAGALLSPVPPVLVSCGTMEKPNILTIGWTGIVNTKPPMTYISVRPERYSHDIIKQSGEFVINLASEELVSAVDFCGVKSGASVDKFKETGLTPVKSSIIAVPSIDQCPISLECVVKDIISFGSHDMFIAEIVEVCADKSLVGDKGLLDYSKAKLLAYSHGEYYSLGKKLGSFGYSVRKKKPKGKPKKYR